jgi:hypothetical protein
MIYRRNIFKVQKWLMVPNIVAKFCDKAFGWLLYSKEPKQLQVGATLELQRQEQAEMWEQQYFYNRAQDFRQARGQGYSERLVDENQDEGLLGSFFRQRRRRGNENGSEPSDEFIQILVDMGFERDRAIDALRISSNDLETATSILLRQ